MARQPRTTSHPGMTGEHAPRHTPRGHGPTAPGAPRGNGRRPRPRRIRRRPRKPTWPRWPRGGERPELRIRHGLGVEERDLRVRAEDAPTAVEQRVLAGHARPHRTLPCDARGEGGIEGLVRGLVAPGEGV